MLKTGLAMILFLFMARCYCQDYHFITIQSDNNQTFYAILEGKVFPSNPSGHLLLSKLKDSVYGIAIGFPGGVYPEQVYSVKVEKEDLRLELKMSGDKEWRLFDPQAKEAMTPLTRSAPERGQALTGIKKDDPFSRLMAGVVNDTAVMYADFIADPPVTVEKTEEKPAGKSVENPVDKSLDKSSEKSLDKRSEKLPEKPSEKPSAETFTAVPAVKDRKDTVLAVDSVMLKRPVISKDTGMNVLMPSGKKTAGTAEDSGIVVINNLVKDPSAGITPAAKEVPLPPLTEKGKKPYIEKLSEKKTAHQVRLLYVDHGKTGKGDTIVIRIPVDTIATIGKNSSVNGKSTDPNPPVSHRVVKDSSSTPLSTDPGTAVGPDAGPLLKKPVLVNSDCSNFASNGDIEKLRGKMMTAISDKDRVDQATKFFRTRCVTTAQIRVLNRLFMNDEGSFQFFKAAYPFVTDSDQFRSLVSLFTDPLVIGKFKKLTGQP